MALYHNILELIGNTPLLQLSGLCQQEQLQANLFGKLESFNPGSSAKDRIALAMIEQAEKQGLLQQDSVIIEPTSGNTGIGLALVAKNKGYRIILTMPETMSIERRKLLSAFGAELVLTDGSTGMKGAIQKAAELAKEIPHSFIPMQFSNPANALAHYRSTGPEILKDMPTPVDIFVAGVGTGGTLSGVGRYLKQHNPSVKIVAVEPADSAVLSGNPAGAHKLQGIGAGFIPEVLDTQLIDCIVPITTQEAFQYARLVSSTDSILVGISSGAALAAAVKLAKLPENAGKSIVVMLPDSGERYLSTTLFEAN